MNTLLICPKFFGYEKDIYGALVSQNHNVTYIDEKPYNNNFFKVLVRLFGKSTFVKWLIKRHIATSLKKMPKEIDCIIVVKGESLSLENVKFLKTVFPRARLIFYAWDSINNYPHVIDYLPLFDNCFTFDDRDIIEYPFFTHLPLFYSKDFENKTAITALTDKPKVVFAGTVHSDRYKLLGEIYKNYKHAFDFEFFLYFPSRLLLFKFIKDNFWEIITYRVFGFSLRSKEKKEIAEFFLNSTAILDIQHPKQHGLTMRTIEILPLQRKIITTNPEIQRYDFFLPENIMVIDRQRPVLTEEFLMAPYQAINPDVLHQYSVEGWVKKLLANKQSTH
ncbi:hypothetical protein ACT3RR_04145 [Ewingella sp. AOP8-B2-18]